MFPTPSPIVETPTDTPAPTPAETPAVTPVDTPVETPADTPAETPVGTPLGTPCISPKLASDFSLSPGPVLSGDESDVGPLRPPSPIHVMPGDAPVPPSVEEGLFEDEGGNIFRQATPDDVTQSFSNANLTLYYCNGKVFYSVYGAFRESSIAWPESPIYECNLVPWKMNYRKKFKLPRVSEQLSEYLNRRNSNELFEEMKAHIGLKCTKNPFSDTMKTVWVATDNLFQTIVSSTVEDLKHLFRDKDIVVTQGWDVCNVCWSVQSKLPLHSYEENPKLFWACFEHTLKERFTTYSKSSGMKNKFISFHNFVQSLRYLVLMGSEEKKKQRHERYKRKREEVEMELEAEVAEVAEVAEGTISVGVVTQT